MKMVTAVDMDKAERKKKRKLQKLEVCLILSSNFNLKVSFIIYFNPAFTDLMFSISCFKKLRWFNMGYLTFNQARYKTLCNVGVAFIATIKLPHLAVGFSYPIFNFLEWGGG